MQEFSVLPSKHRNTSVLIQSLLRVARVGVLSCMLILSGCSQQVRIDTANNTKLQPAVNEPVLDMRLAKEDFAFPSRPPLLSVGKTVYENNCLKCHSAASWQEPKHQQVIRYTTPIDMYLMLTTGKAQDPEITKPTTERLMLLAAGHPTFKEKLSRDDRWSALFYTRYLAGDGDFRFASLNGKPLDVASIYGGNCAVCHGKRGHADGPLHTGKPSSHELAGSRIHGGIFQPPPANFTQYKRFYNRTDAQMFKYVSEGLYPSGMPAWLGNVDRDNNFVFDDKLVWLLIRHVRQFSYKNDLPETAVAPVGPIPVRPASVKPLIPPVPHSLEGMEGAGGLTQEGIQAGHSVASKAIK